MHINMKVEVYQAVAVKRLTWSLYLRLPTQQEADRITGVQARGLRFLQKVPAAYISRVSNARILVKAKKPDIRETWTAERMVFLGHLIRHPENPQFDVAFEDTNLKLRNYGDEGRHGRGRMKWLPTIMEDALELCRVHGQDFRTLVGTTADHGAQRWRRFIHARIPMLPRIRRDF